LPSLIQHLADSHPGARLRLESIKYDSGGAVVELSIEGDDDYSFEQVTQLQRALEEAAQDKIEYQRLALVEREARLELQGNVKQLNSFIDKLLLRPTYYIADQSGILGDSPEKVNYNISGQIGPVGPNAYSHDMTFNQLVNQSGEPIDFAVLATQLSELRQAIMQKQDALPEALIAIGKVAEAEVAAADKNPSEVIKHLRAAGQWTLDFAKSIGKDVVVTAIKKSMDR
jgi:hypothetical protein